MSIRLVLNVVGILEVFFGLSMLVPLCVSLVYRDGDSLAFLLSAVITVGAGLATFRLTRSEQEISPREGFAIVTFAWAFAAAFGSLPYLLTGTVDGVWPAIFEAMSGLTTTGATVFSDIESLPHGIPTWASEGCSSSAPRCRARRRSDCGPASPRRPSSSGWSTWA